MKPQTVRIAVLVVCSIVALLLCACAAGQTTTRGTNGKGIGGPPGTPTPSGAVLASFNGVCTSITSTHAVDVPAGAIIAWSEQPTSSSDQFLLQALYGSTGLQTLDNSAVDSAYSGSAIVPQADTVSFMVMGSGCTWTITIYAGTQNAPAPTTAPPTPTLAASYVFIGNNIAAYIDLKDGIAAVTEVEQPSNPPPSYCLVSRTEQDVTYTQSGTTLTIKAMYIASTPFTVNPDGSIQHEVPQPNGTIATQRYVPGSNADYNAAVQRLAAQYPSC